MTDTKTDMRVFFAIDLPEESKNTINSAVKKLQKNFSRRGIRWAKPEGLHLTLHFLANITSAHLETLSDRVRPHILKIRPFTLELGPIEFFPTPYKPSIIALRANRHPGLLELIEKISADIKLLNYPVEQRPFLPHITLGRINEAGNQHLALPEIAAPLTKLHVNEIILFHSQPQLADSHYTPLEHFPLAH